MAVAHYGSNNMISFRYRLKTVPMKIAEKSFTAEGVEFPAGSFVIPGPSDADARAAVEEFGLTAAALSAVPSVPMHDADAPRIAIYSQWSSTQDLGWYRLTFDNFGIPYDLIFKEQVKQGNLRGKYDVILMAAQNINRQAGAPAAGRPAAAVPEERQVPVPGHVRGDAGHVRRFRPGRRRRVREIPGSRRHADRRRPAPSASRSSSAGPGPSMPSRLTGVTAQRPIIQAEITRPDHPVFYGYAEKTIPMKYVGGTVLRVGSGRPGATSSARYVGGDASVLSGLMVGADQLRDAAVRRRHPERLQRQGPGDSLCQQSDLPLAEPRRVQHDLQLHPELE